MELNELRDNPGATKPASASAGPGSGTADRRPYQGSEIPFGRGHQRLPLAARCRSPASSQARLHAEPGPRCGQPRPDPEVVDAAS